MPSYRDLPYDLRAMVRRNALEVSYTRFSADSERLIKALAAILKQLPSEFESASVIDTTEFASHLAFGKRPRNEAKMIFIGRGGVGKTCLVNRLVNDRFNGHEKATEGISITQWNVELNDIEEVKLNIWDFGGQEIMQGTHQFFLTKQALYILVLAVRDGHEDQEAEYWLKLVESFGGDSPVVVALNKIDEFRFDINRKLL
jgi:internalin A